MKSSLGISLCAHVIIVGALIFLFKAVPEMRLPEGVYSVRILQPFRASAGGGEAQADKAKEESEKAEKPPAPPKKEEPKVPVPKAKDTKKEAEKKTEPPKASAEDKPLDMSVGIGTADGTDIAVDGANFPFSYFLAAIERKVSENWFSAVSEKAAGLTCVVYFTLMRDGSVSDLRLEKSSGNAYFDRAATRAVKSAAPFPPLPKAFTDAYLGIHFTFVQKE
jgi:colicin import membrane protein